MSLSSSSAISPLANKILDLHLHNNYFISYDRTTKKQMEIFIWLTETQINSKKSL